MLVLSRKRNEKVVITTRSGEVITVTMVEIRGDNVRLGFDAEPGIIVHREEVSRAIAAAGGEKQCGADDAKNGGPMSPGYGT